MVTTQYMSQFTHRNQLLRVSQVLPVLRGHSHPQLISGVTRKMPVVQDDRLNVIHLTYPRQELVPGIEIFHDQQ